MRYLAFVKAFWVHFTTPNFTDINNTFVCFLSFTFFLLLNWSHPLTYIFVQQKQLSQTQWFTKLDIPTQPTLRHFWFCQTLCWLSYTLWSPVQGVLTPLTPMYPTSWVDEGGHTVHITCCCSALQRLYIKSILLWYVSFCIAIVIKTLIWYMFWKSGLRNWLQIK